MSIFTYDPATYQSKRDFNYVETYIRDMALGLSKTENVTVEFAENFIREGIKMGTIHFHDPAVYALKREENADKHKYKTTMQGYLKEVQKNKHIMAPTFTSYLHPMVKKSELSTFTEYNVNDRNAKKAMIKVHTTAGRPIQAMMANNGQKNAKENNNSTSGAMVSKHNPIYNRSGHSTLTSVCRTCASTANANTERFTVGKRHFMDVNTVIHNILNVINNMDLEECRRVIEKYNLSYVTHEQFMKGIRRSTDLYWRSKKGMERIEELALKLTPLERTVYLYTGDFYHVRVYNEAFVRTFFDGFIHIPRNITVDNPDEIMKTVDEDMAMLTAILFNPELKTKDDKGKDLYLPTLAKGVKELPTYPFIAAGVVWINEHIEKYADFIRCFWRNDCFPMETGQMPEMVRTAVLGGDTDSTLFTVWSWVLWYTGELRDTYECISVAQVIIYLTSMMVKHYLAIVSGVMGVQKKRIHQMAMKNEFFFATFTTTRRTKHYFAMATACEGLVYQKPELEIKGVGLKNRKSPTEIIAKADAFMEWISETAFKEGSFEIMPKLREIAEMEYYIFSSIMKGSTDFLKQESIKDASIYKEPMRSNWASYNLWEEVFAEKYGHVPSLPMQGVRVNLDLNTKTQVKTWIEHIEDRTIADKLQNWLTKNNKAGFKSLILPIDIVAMRGIPAEIRPIMNIRKIIFGLMETFYVILESLNFYMIDSNNTRLVLDEFPELFEHEEEYRQFMDNSIVGE